MGRAPTFIAGHDYSLDWKVERGHLDGSRPLTDAECDRAERLRSERDEETRGWTRHYFERLFGITRARTGRHEMGPDKDDVRERASVLALLASRGVEHRVVGGNAIYRCPWHDDRRPSASFSIKKKVYFCHPCSEGGDIFLWVCRFDNVPFAEAVETLNRL